MLSHKLPDILMAKMLVYKVASTFHVPHHQQLLFPLCLEVADTAPGKRIEHIHNCSQGFWHSGEGGGVSESRGHRCYRFRLALI